MPRPTRRAVLAGLGAGAAAIPFDRWLAERAWAGPARVRYEATSPQGQQMVTKYATAVQKMMQTAEGKPCSWTFQWYTHWTKGSTTKAAELTRIYPQATPDKALAQDMWDTCQAHGPGEDENMFLPWHRMFVFYFEDIIRTVLNDAAFTLPYWNYSAAATRAMPAPFRASGSPLFRTSRNAGPNGGQGIPTNQVALTVLQQASYGPQGAAQGFCATLDFGLHGNVHVWVGNSQGMGQIPWAAYDPIFWMHHCNIDRLWASWNKGGRANPTGAWLQQGFTFADAQCAKVTAKVGDVDDIAKLNYSYDRLEPVPAIREPVRPAAAVVHLATPAAAGPSIALGAGPVRVALQPAGGAGAAAPRLSTRLAALPAGRSLYLVLENAMADAQPGVVYDVYLDLPQGAAATPASPYFAGTINFFAAAHPMGAAAGAMPARTFSLDVTGMAKGLAARGQLTGTPSVTIVPAGQPDAAARPVIGAVRLVEQ